MTPLLFSLEEFLVTGIFAFILIFVRIGTALMIMPGLGDSFVPQNVRLYMALALSLMLTPYILPQVPVIPGNGMLFIMIIVEFITGLFIGTIARILMLALDTAGMIISMSSGIANAQLFNPVMATQGSLGGAFLSVTGVLVLMGSNMHHLLLEGLVGSYEMFPVGNIPDTGSMAELMARAISASFLTGVQISIPFVVLSLLLYIGMGVLSRLMPQVQVFLLAIPLQILLSLLVLSMVLSATFLFFLARFEDGMVFFLSSAGPAPGGEGQ